MFHLQIHSGTLGSFLPWSRRECCHDSERDWNCEWIETSSISPLRLIPRNYQEIAEESISSTWSSILDLVRIPHLRKALLLAVCCLQVSSLIPISRGERCCKWCLMQKSQCWKMEEFLRIALLSGRSSIIRHFSSKISTSIGKIRVRKRITSQTFSGIAKWAATAMCVSYFVCTVIGGTFVDR